MGFSWALCFSEDGGELPDTLLMDRHLAPAMTRDFGFSLTVSVPWAVTA